MSFLLSSILPKNERKSTSSRIVFVRFLGELKTSQIHFEIKRPLVASNYQWKMCQILTAFSEYLNFTTCRNEFIQVCTLTCQKKCASNHINFQKCFFYTFYLHERYKNPRKFSQSLEIIPPLKTKKKPSHILVLPTEMPLSRFYSISY